VPITTPQERTRPATHGADKGLGPPPCRDATLLCHAEAQPPRPVSVRSRWQRRLTEAPPLARQTNHADIVDCCGFDHAPATLGHQRAQVLCRGCRPTLRGYVVSIVLRSLPMRLDRSLQRTRTLRRTLLGSILPKGFTVTIDASRTKGQRDSSFCWIAPGAVRLKALRVHPLRPLFARHFSFRAARISFETANAVP